MKQTNDSILRREWYKKYKASSPDMKRQMRLDIAKINLGRWEMENKNLNNGGSK